VVGVISLAYGPESDQTFSDDEVGSLTQFAQLASIAIENARLFDESQKAKEAAEAANEAKSAFLANVSHELRTPLTSVLGFAKIIQKRLDERIFPIIFTADQKTAQTINQVKKNLNIIIIEAERLTALINNVLDLSRIEAGKVGWQLQSLVVSELIEQAIAATAALTEAKGLEMITDIPSDLPEILGDRDRLIQVMINLIANAAKFTYQGSITCRAAFFPPTGGQRGGEIVISVIDTGVGIAEADQSHVFEKFKQVGDTLTDKPGGVGLGLPICQQIVAYHGGQIWVESALGLGSSFSFSLPLKAEAETNRQDLALRKGT
jgi:signal transduction histidine kinase